MVWVFITDLTGVPLFGRSALESDEQCVNRADDQCGSSGNAGVQEHLVIALFNTLQQKSADGNQS